MDEETNPTAPVIEADPVEARYALLMDQLNEKYDTQIRFFRWISSVSFTLVIIAGGSLAFVFNGSLAAVRADLQNSVDGYLDRTVTEGSARFDDINGLKEAFLTATQELEGLQGTIDNLRFLDRLPGQVDEIEPSIYARLRQLEQEGERESEASEQVVLSDAQYLEVAILLQRALDAALSGRLDPNEVFNISIISARMGFEAQVAQLRTVAYHITPSSDNRAAMLASQDLFGIGYEVVDGQLRADGRPASAVREEAWFALRLLAGSVPMEGQTQAYSQAGNVAARNRTFGYHQQLMETLESVVSERPELVTAYTHATLSDLHSRIGGTGWRNRFEAERARAIELLAMESPAAPIYAASIRGMFQDAFRMGREEVAVLTQLLDERGILWRAVVGVSSQ